MTFAETMWLIVAAECAICLVLNRITRQLKQRQRELQVEVERRILAELLARDVPVVSATFEWLPDTDRRPVKITVTKVHPPTPPFS